MTRPSRRALTVSVVSVVSLTIAACASRPLPAPTGTRAGTAAVEVAPYVDVTLDVVPDLAGAVRRGVRVVNLGFVTASGGDCRPAWGGSLRYDDVSVVRRIGEVRAAGGDVRIAFGGQSGTELALACRTPSDLARAYGRVLDVLGVTQVDLDVEGTGLQDRDAVHRRDLAVRLLQQAAGRAGRPVRVSYTLPADDAGLSAAARDLLDDAAHAGVEVDVVNAMTMDVGARAPDLEKVSASAAGQAEAFVRGLWPQRAVGGGAWGMIAVTPMIGMNDLPSEVFGLDDALRLGAFARAHRLARLSFWSLNRDRPCAAGTGVAGKGVAGKGVAGTGSVGEGSAPGGGADPGCSGVQQRPGDFTAAFTGGGGAG